MTSTILVGQSLFREFYQLGKAIGSIARSLGKISWLIAKGFFSVSFIFLHGPTIKRAIEPGKYEEIRPMDVVWKAKLGPPPSIHQIM